MPNYTPIPCTDCVSFAICKSIYLRSCEIEKEIDKHSPYADVTARVALYDRCELIKDWGLIRAEECRDDYRLKSSAEVMTSHFRNELYI